MLHVVRGLSTEVECRFIRMRRVMLKNTPVCLCLSSAAFFFNVGGHAEHECCIALKCCDCLALHFLGPDLQCEQVRSTALLPQKSFTWRRAVLQQALLPCVLGADTVNAIRSWFCSCFSLQKHFASVLCRPSCGAVAPHATLGRLQHSLGV